MRPYIIDNHDDVSAFLIILYSLVARIAVRVGPLVARTGRAPLAPDAYRERPFFKIIRQARHSARVAGLAR